MKNMFIDLLFPENPLQEILRTPQTVQVALEGPRLRTIKKTFLCQRTIKRRFCCKENLHRLRSPLVDDMSTILFTINISLTHADI